MIGPPLPNEYYRGNRRRNNREWLHPIDTNADYYRYGGGGRGYTPTRLKYPPPYIDDRPDVG
jgi:hypothetical protein